MSPRVTSILTAEGFAIDQVTARVTAFNVMDQFAVGSVPVRIVRFVVLVSYELGESETTGTEYVRVVRPDGGVVAESRQGLHLGAREPGQGPFSHRSIHSLWNVQFDDAGEHRVVVTMDTGSETIELGSVPLAIIVAPGRGLQAPRPPHSELVD